MILAYSSVIIDPLVTQKEQAMKKAILLGGLLTAMSMTAMAEDHGHKGHYGQKMLDRMAERLELTPDQRTKVGDILKKEQAAHRALREDSRKQIEALLNDKQKAEHEKMRKEHQARMEKHKEKWKKRMKQDAGN
jgi:Spy/CpxP family protein refolding chaperone